MRPSLLSWAQAVSEKSAEVTLCLCVNKKVSRHVFLAIIDFGSLMTFLQMLRASHPSSRRSGTV